MSKMQIDFKNVTFSFKKLKKQKMLKRIRLISLIVLILISYLIYLKISNTNKLDHIQDLLLKSNIKQARQEFKDFENSLFNNNSKQELRALMFLFNNQAEKSGELLKNLDPKSTDIKQEQFLNLFIDRGEYKEAEIYANYLNSSKRSIILSRAFTKTALFKPLQSEKLLWQLKKNNYKIEVKKEQIIHRINQDLKAGKLPYIYDRNNKSLAYYDLKIQKTVSLTPGFSFQDFTPQIKKGIKFYTLSLDLNIQKKIHSLMKTYRGSFVLINLYDSSITAAYSTNKKIPNSFFTLKYEPGSIIKVITLLAYLKLNRNNLFPLNCTKPLSVENKFISDVLPHKKVASFEKALAVSCNVAFARIALEIGKENLFRVFKKFRFSSAGFYDLFLHFETGTIQNNFSGNYTMIRQSLGLNPLTSTTFHSAYISSIIALNGSLYNPYLIIGIKNIQRISCYNHQPQLLKIFEKSNIEFLKVKKAMQKVTDDPQGTGRRSKVKFINTAIKTGTAGSKKRGQELDSIIFGFFPAENPKFAFAFRLKNTGRAEFKGALFFKEFLKSFYNK